MGDAVVGGALLEARTAGLGAGVAVAALGLLRLVAGRVATHEAQTGHDSQAVGLGFGSNEGGTGHDGKGREAHLDGFLGSSWRDGGETNGERSKEIEVGCVVKSV